MRSAGDVVQRWRCGADPGLGIEVGSGKPGPFNAITDVPGVKVGHCTLIEGEGALRPDSGPVRTGVTASTATAS